MFFRCWTQLIVVIISSRTNRSLGSCPGPAPVVRQVQLVEDQIEACTTPHTMDWSPFAPAATRSPPVLVQKSLRQVPPPSRSLNRQAPLGTPRIRFHTRQQFTIPTLALWAPPHTPDLLRLVARNADVFIRKIHLP